MAFSEDVATRFIGYGWNVTRGRDANDLGMLERAFQVFRNTGERPILIIVDRHIAYGSPTKRDSSAAQRRALGRGGDPADKTQLWLAGGRKFLVPTGVRTHFQAGIGKRGCALRESWIAKFADYMVAHPDFADQLYKMHHRQLSPDWSKDLPEFPADPKGIAPRDSSGKVLNILARNVPRPVGGAADFAPSTKTRLMFEGSSDFSGESRFGLWLCRERCEERRMTHEEKRLEESRNPSVPWKLWGPYLSERQWETVREDYSSSGTVNLIGYSPCSREAIRDSGDETSRKPLAKRSMRRFRTSSSSRSDRLLRAGPPRSGGSVSAGASPVCFTGDWYAWRSWPARNETGPVDRHRLGPGFWSSASFVVSRLADDAWESASRGRASGSGDAGRRILSWNRDLFFVAGP